MKLCNKGLHDLDKPGNRVKNGKRAGGSPRNTCGPCKSGRQTEWLIVNRIHRDKLVCDYGHIFTVTNTHWRTDKDGNLESRKCRRCMTEKSAAYRACVKRVKASPEKIAEMEAIAAGMRPEELATWESKEREEERSKPWEVPVWTELALCANRDPELFFTQDWENPDEEQGREAKAKSICGQCAVRALCLDYAIRRNEHYGIWGGLNRIERIDMARQRRKQLAAA
jgi:WhiB family transcriptional regulator, redox-sensing transcriptional regulator